LERGGSAFWGMALRGILTTIGGAEDSAVDIFVFNIEVFGSGDASGVRVASVGD